MQIAIVLYPGMTALDAIGPYEVLRGLPDHELRFVWKEAGPIVTDSGVLVLGATHSLDETPAPDVVLVPGSGARTASMMADRELLGWLRAVHEQTRVTASVCSGSLILAAAGILEGRAATSHWGALPLLPRFGAQACSQQRIVRDGKVWTAAGVSAGIDLALALVAELSSEHRARVVQLIIEYDPQPPFDSGHVERASADVRREAMSEMRKSMLSPSEMFALPVALCRRWQALLVARVRRAPPHGQRPG